MGLCEQFGTLPSALYEEDAELLRMLEIIRLGSSKTKEGGGDVE